MNLLAIHSLTRTYAITPSVGALRGLNLEVETGERVLIVGYSGVRKSTLLNVLGLLGESNGGEYLFKGEHVEYLPEARHNFIHTRKIGFAFQGFYVLEHRSVTEDLELKLSINHIPHARRGTMIAGTLEAVRLSGRAKTLTCLLPRGERQRFAFARAVIRDPQLILVDEPTGNLDRKSAVTILGLLDAQAEKDVTMVAISHDERLRNWTNRMLRLESGMLHED